MLSLLLIACSTPPPEVPVLPPAPGVSAPIGEPLSFPATLRIDPTPGGKKLQGVWLERADGAQWVIDDRPRDCWRALEGLEVTATGAVYAPQGQAISATHFKVESLEVLKVTAEVLLEVVGPEQTLTGTLLTATGAPGTKSKGSALTEFQDADGPVWPLYNPSALDGLTGVVTLTVREVELSPFSAHISGPQLCILSARSATP